MGREMNVVPIDGAGHDDALALSLEPGGVLPDQLQQAFADGRRSVLGDLTEDDAAVERGNR